MLQIDQIQVNYGAAPALWDISLHINPGELISVIGPNGAGKTTLINAVMGLNPLKSGKIVWEGDHLDQCGHGSEPPEIRKNRVGRGDGVLATAPSIVRTWPGFGSRKPKVVYHHDCA